MKKIPVKAYLKRIEELEINPNFYVSEAYISLIGAECYEDKGYLIVRDGKWLLFPPIPTEAILPEWQYPLPYNFWSDFDNFHPKSPKYEFLDYEYIFDPRNFNTLSGGKWETFRKNSRKWLKGASKPFYSSHHKRNDVLLLLAEWLEKKDKQCQDAALIVKFVLSHNHGIGRAYLYDEDQLMAINIWNENYKYINYCYCIVKQGEPYLDEYARLLFYTDLQIQVKNKLVNDGGVIGNAGLEAFKDKLNPLRKRKVFSWFNY
jgi:hypothetical protein